MVVAENDELPEFRRRITELTNQAEENLQYTKINKYDPGQEFGQHCDATAHTDADVFMQRGQPSNDYFGDRITAEKGLWETFNKPCVNRFISVRSTRQTSLHMQAREPELLACSCMLYTRYTT